jgi:hypothetical protein
MKGESLINPNPLDEALVAGLMTKKPYLKWYEIRGYFQWKRAQRRWRMYLAIRQQFLAAKEAFDG